MSEFKLETFGEESVFLEGWYTISEIEQILIDMKKAEALHAKHLKEMMRPIK